MSSFKENLKATGKVNFKLFDKDGKIKEDRTINNLVVTSGLQHMVARITDTDVPSPMSHMALGDGDASPSLNNTGLGSELDRVELTVIGGTPSGTTISYSATFPAGVATGSITEAGIFNDDGDPSSGDMLCRTTFLVINKALEDSLAVLWEVVIS